MNFAPGDIVQFVHHNMPHVIGRSAEIVGVYPDASHHAFLHWIGGGHFTWYTLTDSEGVRRAAPHPWLRKLPPLWTPSNTLTETTA